MHSLQTNYNFTITVIHYHYLKTLSKIIPLNQHKFTFEIRVKKLDANLVYMNMKIREYENTHMNNRANLYKLLQIYTEQICFDSSKHDAYIECYK